MKFVFFRTNTPRKFSYRPRYYNPEKEAMEQRRAEMGLENQLSEGEAIRARMSAKWRHKQPEKFGNRYKKMSIVVYLVVILGGIFLVFFTDFVDNIVRAFGLLN